MSHHIISGKDEQNGKASPILAKSNSLAVDTGFPTIEIKHILNNQSIAAGATFTSSAIEFRKRTKILIVGTSTLNNVSIGFEVSPDISNPTTYLETFENVEILNGAVYSFVNLYTDYFRLKITNNEVNPVTVNLYATSKN